MASLSFGLVLLTGVPESLREVAATNLPALPSILWDDFSDNRKPDWFLQLPLEIQVYLVKKFGPPTAWPTQAPSSLISDGSATLTAIASVTTEPEQTFQPPSSIGSSQIPAESAAESSLIGSTAPANGPASFQTSYTTSSDASAPQSPASPSEAQTSSERSFTRPSTTPSSISDPEHPEISDGGLSRDQKVGLGVGIPFGLLATAALVFGCCALCRRRNRRNMEGSIPPESPGFIPRFAFQEQFDENPEHRMPLNHEVDRNNDTVWEDQGVEPRGSISTRSFQAKGLGTNGQTSSRAQPPALSDHDTSDRDPDVHHFTNIPVATMRDPTPIMAPALHHTHTSNRARGKRTSYTSLHSVAEVSEFDETEPTILGRRAPTNHGPTRDLITSPVPVGAQVKRKPVPSSPPSHPSPLLPTSPSPVAISPAAKVASHTLARQKMPEHSGSSSSGLALSTSTGLTSDSSLVVHAGPTSPVSPGSNCSQSNPFHYDSYIEDYGPEYQNGYVDVEDGLYGGNTSLHLLSQYAAEPRRKNSKTEWPLRNLVGSQHQRRSSPIWERICEE